MPFRAAAPIIVAAVLTSACGTVNRLAVKGVADTLSQGGDTVTSHDDPVKGAWRVGWRADAPVVDRPRQSGYSLWHRATTDGDWTAVGCSKCSYLLADLRASSS